MADTGGGGPLTAEELNAKIRRAAERVAKAKDKAKAAAAEAKARKADVEKAQEDLIATIRDDPWGELDVRPAKGN